MFIMSAVAVWPAGYRWAILFIIVIIIALTTLVSSSCRVCAVLEKENINMTTMERTVSMCLSKVRNTNISLTANNVPLNDLSTGADSVVTNHSIPHSQTRALSQEANNRSGMYSICFATRQNRYCTWSKEHFLYWLRSATSPRLGAASTVKTTAAIEYYSITLVRLSTQWIIIQPQNQSCNTVTFDIRCKTSQYLKEYLKVLDQLCPNC